MKDREMKLTCYFDVLAAYWVTEITDGLILGEGEFKGDNYVFGFPVAPLH